MDYVSKTRNAAQETLRDHISAFEESYEAVYSADYGKFNLKRISESVERFLKCGEYIGHILRDLAVVHQNNDHPVFLKIK